MACCTAATSRKIRLALGSNDWPAWVREIFRPTRSNNGLPSCCSSVAIRLLMAGWVKWRRWPAAENEPGSATATNGRQRTEERREGKERRKARRKEDSKKKSHTARAGVR